MRTLIPLLTIFALTLPGPTTAQGMPPDPDPLYYAKVVRVVDGDTLNVRVDLQQRLQAVYSVRVRGIDAPELRGSACEGERLWAEEARAQVAKLYDTGAIVRLEDVEYDAFAGRVVADVRRWRSGRWIYLVDELAESGLSEAWTPDIPDIDWRQLPGQRQRWQATRDSGAAVLNRAAQPLRLTGA